MTQDAALRNVGPRWYLRPAVALPAIIAVLVLLAVLTPETTNARRGDSRLTTHSAGPQGAKLLYELAARLGWRVRRHSERGVPELGANGSLALLDPVDPLTAAETHRLLEQVRGGAGLLYVSDVSSPLADSLHLRRGIGLGGIYQATPAGSAEAPGVVSSSADTVSDSAAVANQRNRSAAAGDSNRVAAANDSGVLADSAADADSAVDDDVEATGECTVGGYGGGVPLWPDGEIHLFRLEWRRPPPADAVTFADVRNESVSGKTTRTDPAAVGFPLGRGRVVVLSDPDLLRNDVLRVCGWGADVAVVRMLEYLRAGPVPRQLMVFDEYHQGFGAHPGTMRAIALYLSRTPSGHALGQVLLAGLVLLLALGPRALPPRDTDRVERRSPLEHVSALASAYEQVGATRTAANRLLRGVRRRLERATQSYGTHRTEQTDDAFLAAALRGDPSLNDDVALIRRSLNAALSSHDFEALGGALRRLETSLLTLRR